jgi:energy-coupling factor transporter ATP-binding protein EcfA2
MKIHKISIKNILGVEALEFAPGAITRITGGNGQGKTSVLEAIKAICKGGYDATLLRNGQSKGEVVIELDGGLQVSKRVTEKGAYLTVTKDGAKVDKPADFLSGLWDSLSANPVEFMTAPQKKRIDWLLEQIDPKPVIQKLRAIEPDFIEPPAANALAAMEQARKAIFDARTDANRTEKQARETADVLAEDLPEESGDVAAKLEAAKTEHMGYDMALKAELERVREERDEALRAIGEDMEKELQLVRVKFHQLGITNRENADHAAEQLRAKTQPKIAAAAAEVARLKEAQRTADEAAGRRKLLAKNRETAAAAKAQAQALTAKLDKIDALKKQVLESLPIPGVEVIDGDIHKDGVPFDRLNTATQWAVAIAIAKRRAGEIPLICADGLEALDDANFAAFSEMAADSGLHFIVTDRGNGPLAVDTEGKR